MYTNIHTNIYIVLQNKLRVSHTYNLCNKIKTIIPIDNLLFFVRSDIPYFLNFAWEL